MVHIESVNQKLNEKQEKLWEEINKLQDELKRNQDPERMTLLQGMISVSSTGNHRYRYRSMLLIKDMLGQMSRIREKATESEAVVRNITKDIQVLDLAKKNLITSMTVLRRLQMLGSFIVFSSPILSDLLFPVNAMTQLEDHIKEKKYKEASESLAVRRACCA